MCHVMQRKKLWGQKAKRCQIIELKIVLVVSPVMDLVENCEPSKYYGVKQEMMAARAVPQLSKGLSASTCIGMAFQGSSAASYSRTTKPW